MRAASNRLKGKIAVVTGSASGIGRASALLFAREGATVFVADRNEDGAKATADAARNAGGTAVEISCDVSSKSQVAGLFAEVDRRCGQLDVLYNNAGIAGRPSGIIDIDEADWNDVMNVNLAGMVDCCRHALPLMRTGGSIVNQSSLAALVGGGPPHVGPVTAYSVSKAAVIALTKSIAYQFGERNIRCNAILPGSIETDMTSPIMSSSKYVNAVKRSTPLGRFGSPDEIAQAALFLASPESSFVTGVALLVDGGFFVAQGPVFTQPDL